MVSGWSRRRTLASAGGVYVILTLVLVGLAAWQWVTLSWVTALRNIEMHQNEQNSEWAEVAPGLILMGALVMLAVAAAAGFASRSKEQRTLIAFATCCSIAALVLIVAGSLVVTKTEQPQIDTYVKISLYDAFHPMRNGAPEAMEAFGAAERALGCCGVEDARDYRGWTVARGGVPASCCGDRRAVCDFNDHEVNARLGCTIVMTESMKTAYRWAGAGALLAGCVCALSPALAWMLHVPVRPVRAEDEPPDSDEPGDD